MREQGVSTVKNASNGIDPMRSERNFQIHTYKVQVLAVILTGADRIELLIIQLCKPFAALSVFPNPFSKGFLKCFIYSPLFKKIGGGVPPMTSLRPFGLACVIEQALNLGRYSRHNGGIKEHIQTCEQERPDDNGDENFYA